MACLRGTHGKGWAQRTNIAENKRQFTPRAYYIFFLFYLGKLVLSYALQTPDSDPHLPREKGVCPGNVLNKCAQHRGRRALGGLRVVLAGLRFSQPFENTIFKHLSACTADFWQGNFVLFQKLCWIWKTTITVFILSCQRLRTIRTALYSLHAHSDTLPGSNLAVSHESH